MAAAHDEFVGGLPKRDSQAHGDPSARRLAEIGFAREEILLIADEVARGQEAAVEITR